MSRILIIVVSLAFVSSDISAENYTPKFDQGVDLKEFIQEAASPSLQTCAPFPEISFATAKTPQLVKKLSKPRAGSYFGPLQPIVTGNKAYSYAQKYPPLIQPSQAPVAKELMIQWVNIENARVLLLDEADGLETKDAELYSDGEQIAQNAAVLNKEIAALKAEIAAYNKQCAGQPVNTNCTNWYNKLIAWQEDVKKRIAAHNAAYTAWEERAKALTDSVDGWKGRVNIWEQAILYFIESAQAFLADTGDCTFERHRELQNQVDDACKIPGQPYKCTQWNPNDPALDCEQWARQHELNLKCAKARHDINTECYKGGDPTHKREEELALERAKECDELIAKFCLKTKIPSIPPRVYPTQPRVTSGWLWSNSQFGYPDGQK